MTEDLVHSDEDYLDFTFLPVLELHHQHDENNNSSLSTSKRLINAFCIQIHPKEASSIIHKLDTLKPILLFPHLKRVKRIQSYKDICCTQSNSSKGKKVAYHDFELWMLIDIFKEESQIIIEQEKIIDWLSQYHIPYLKYQLFLVPEAAPQSLREYELLNQIWPMKYHDKPPAYVSWDEMDLLYKQFISANVLQLLDDNLKEKCKSKAFLLDPLSCQVLFRSEDDNFELESNPLAHSTIKILNMLSKKQRDDNNTTFHGEHHDLIESSHITMEKIVRPYLATGLDLLITYEPCIMCAMALLHSRIRRVYYLRRRFGRGGLGSTVLIHKHSLLNHHYSVYEYKKLNVSPST